jgi:hypothetical protein
VVADNVRERRCLRLSAPFWAALTAAYNEDPSAGLTIS